MSIYENLKLSDFGVLFAIAFVLACVVCVLTLIAYFAQKKALNRAESLLATQKSFEALFYSLPVAISVIDNKNAKFLYVNDAFLTLFAFTDRRSALLKHAFNIAADTQTDGVKKTDKFTKIFEDYAPLHTEITFKDANGAMFDGALLSVYIDYNGKPCTIGIYRDLTPEKKEQKILQNAIKKEKEEKNYIIDCLTYLSADAKNPLSSIISLTENQKELKRESTEKIYAAASSILQIIDDCLSLANLQLMDIKPKNDEFALDDVLSGALIEVTGHYHGEHYVSVLLNTSLDLPRYVLGEKKQLRQVLKGFLDNSAKYTSSGRIVLSVSLDAEKTNNTTCYITFMIKDTGYAQEREASLAAQDDETLAHGVKAARKLVTLMGGNYSFECDKNGALIRFTVPFFYSNNRETTMQTIDTPQLLGLNMLLVDSDELSLKIMERLLKCSKVNTALARGTKEAIDIVTKYREKGVYFDVLLLDNSTYDLSGLTAAVNIHLSLLKPPKIILIAPYNKVLPESVIESTYIDEVIEKPFVPTQFIQKICSVLSSYNMPGDTRLKDLKYKDVTILICDDNVINQEITSRMLEEFGISCVIADNGKKAVEMLQSGQTADLIFMDLYMPVMDGFEATVAIRADKRLSHIPIISLSADAMPHVIDKCIECGMNGHLPKPIEYTVLSDLLKRRLPESKRRNQI